MCHHTAITSPCVPNAIQPADGRWLAGMHSQGAHHGVASLVWARRDTADVTLDGLLWLVRGDWLASNATALPQIEAALQQDHQTELSYTSCGLAGCSLQRTYMESSYEQEWLYFCTRISCRWLCCISSAVRSNRTKNNARLRESASSTAIGLL